jgi:hypothetical protein
MAQNLISGQNKNFFSNGTKFIVKKEYPHRIPGYVFLWWDPSSITGQKRTTHTLGKDKF